MRTQLQQLASQSITTLALSELRLHANLVVQVHISGSAQLCLLRRTLCFAMKACREVCLFAGRHCEALVVVSVRCNLRHWRNVRSSLKLTWLQAPCHLRLLEAHDPTRPAPQDEVVPCSGCNGECLLTGRCASLPRTLRTKPRALCSSRPA